MAWSHFVGQLRIVKQPELIWKQPTKIDWQNWVLITMPWLLNTAEFNFHGLNITKISQKWVCSWVFSIWWERQALEHCNCVLCCLSNSCLRKSKRYSKHFTYRDILWQLKMLRKKECHIYTHTHKYTQVCVHV